MNSIKLSKLNEIQVNATMPFAVIEFKVPHKMNFCFTGSMKAIFYLIVLPIFLIGVRANTRAVPGDAALKKLIEGNKRYIHSKLQHPDQSIQRVKELAKAQHPFAAILGCSDSRVPPEVLFDQGLGDLFVVREIGNIVDNGTLASLEYAVEHLGVSLIMVLGHESCGAVDAAIHNNCRGHIASLVKLILPAVEQAKVMKGDLLENSIRLNIEKVVHQLTLSQPTLMEFVKKGKVRIIGGYYSLDTGEVKLVSPKS